MEKTARKTIKFNRIVRNQNLGKSWSIRQNDHYDLNTRDYFLWEYLKQRVYHRVYLAVKYIMEIGPGLPKRIKTLKNNIKRDKKNII